MPTSVVHSELGTKFNDERLLHKVRELKGKLNHDIQAESKAEYKKQKREIRKQSNE